MPTLTYPQKLYEKFNVRGLLSWKMYISWNAFEICCTNTFAQTSVVVCSENTNNQKLMLEYEKYQELQAKSQKMQEDYERQLQEQEESHNSALQEQTEHYSKRLEEKESQLAQVRQTKTTLIQ